MYNIYIYYTYMSMVICVDTVNIFLIYRNNFKRVPAKTAIKNPELIHHVFEIWLVFINIFDYKVRGKIRHFIEPVLTSIVVFVCSSILPLIYRTIKFLTPRAILLKWVIKDSTWGETSRLSPLMNSIFN